MAGAEDPIAKIERSISRLETQIETLEEKEGKSYDELKPLHTRLAALQEEKVMRLKQQQGARTHALGS